MACTASGNCVYAIRRLPPNHTDIPGGSSSTKPSGPEVQGRKIDGAFSKINFSQERQETIHTKYRPKFHFQATWPIITGAADDAVGDVTIQSLMT